MEKTSEQLFLERMVDVMEEYLWETYELNLDARVELSGRLKTTWGYFTVERELRGGGFYRRMGDVKVIRFNKALIGAKNQDVVESIARHEATHYALYTLGRPHVDGHPEFEWELEKNGVVSTGVDLEDLGVSIKVYTWVCGECRSMVVQTGGKTRINYSNGYRSTCCGGNLVETGWQVIEPGQTKILEEEKVG